MSAEAQIEVHETRGTDSLIEVSVPGDSGEVSTVLLTMGDSGQFLTSPPPGSPCESDGGTQITCEVPGQSSIFLTVRDTDTAVGVTGGRLCATGPSGERVCAPLTNDVPTPTVEVDPLLSGGAALLLVALVAWRSSLRRQFDRR